MAQELRSITTDKAPPAMGPYSQAITTDGPRDNALSNRYRIRRPSDTFAVAGRTEGWLLTLAARSRMSGDDSSRVDSVHCCLTTKVPGSSRPGPISGRAPIGGERHEHASSTAGDVRADRARRCGWERRRRERGDRVGWAESEWRWRAG